MTIEIKKVAVLGCGLMGSGIAEVCARAGLDTAVMEVTADLLERGLGRIRASLDKGVQKGGVSREDADAALGRIRGTTDPGELKGVDLFIEAVIENIEEKGKLYQVLSKVASPDAIFASNTSSLSITELAATTDRPDRFIGLHFFNPAPRMKLVETVRTLATLPEVIEAGEAFIRNLGKEPIRAPDGPGFIVNRLLIPFLLDAIRMVEAKVAEPEAIDKAMTLGAGHPMGPLALLDFVGLDTSLYIADIFYGELREARFAPPPLLKRMVALGYLGRKSGKGFFDYSARSR
ncbi:MAG: 3-hydroxybutyryl-CoA dehydrogenase [Planctomycetota bacterium]|nr:3-hydroxybutyryl-CoA dehydrogenase [Planctomycetota bacterium]